MPKSTAEPVRATSGVAKRDANRSSAFPPKISAVVGVAVVILAIGSAMMVNSSNPIVLPALATCGVAVAALALAGWSKLADKTDPMVWMNIAFIAMFGMHPIAVESSGILYAPYHNLYYLEPTYAAATWLGFAATVSFNAGVFVSRHMATRNSTVPHGFLDGLSEQDRAARAKLAQTTAWLVLLLAMLAYAAFAISAGRNPIEAILGGARRGDVVSSTAYLYYAPQMIGPATVLFLYSALLRRKRPIGAIVLCVVQLYLFLPGGQRLVLLLTLVPVVLAYFLLTGKRVATLTVVAAAVPAIILLISMRDLGATDGLDLIGSLSRFFENPGAQLLEFSTGDDTEMIDALAVELQVVPSQLPHAPLSVLQTTLAAPIPSLIWPSKPQPMDSILNQYLIGTGQNNAGLAYSFVGEAYFDGGIFGVIVAFIGLGVLSNVTYSLRWRASSPAALLVYAALVPTSISLVRGSLAYALGRALFTVGPLVVYALVERSRSAQAVDRTVSTRASSPRAGVRQ